MEKIVKSPFFKDEAKTIITSPNVVRVQKKDGSYFQVGKPINGIIPKVSSINRNFNFDSLDGKPKTQVLYLNFERERGAEPIASFAIQRFRKVYFSDYLRDNDISITAEAAYLKMLNAGNSDANFNYPAYFKQDYDVRALVSHIEKMNQAAIYRSLCEAITEKIDGNVVTYMDDIGLTLSRGINEDIHYAILKNEYCPSSDEELEEAVALASNMLLFLEDDSKSGKFGKLPVDYLLAKAIFGNTTRKK